MKPFIVLLYPLRTCLRIIRDIDGAFNFLTYKLLPKPYTITGACKKRGLCCKNIAVYIPKRFFTSPLLLKLVIGWYSFVYNFTYLHQNESEQVLLFSCGYLKEKGCSIYWKRPFICRNYPDVAQFFKRPTFLPGCGYKITGLSDNSDT